MAIKLWTTTPTSNSDFIIAGGGNSTVDGGNGNDLILGDSVTPLTYGTTTNGDAPVSINNAAYWTTDENPFFEDASIPHTSLFVQAEGGSSQYAKVTVGAGETLTIDIDFGYDFSIGSYSDLIVTLIDSTGAVVAINDYANDFGVGGAGSVYGNDPFLTYTNWSGPTQAFTIRFSESWNGMSVPFDGGETFVANISVTGHVVTTPTAMGDDMLSGGFGDDILAGMGGNDSLYGNVGYDTLIGGTGNDLLDGGDYTDTASYEDASGPVTVDLSVIGAQDTVNAGMDTLVSIERLIGSRFSDTLSGDANANSLWGRRGNDTISGGGASDYLYGEDGEDTLSGGDGNDYLYGDRNDYRTSFANILYGDAGDDYLYGGFGNDTLNGGVGNDIISDPGGNDWIAGGSGIDELQFWSTAFGGVTVDLRVTVAQDTVGAGIDLITSIENLTGSYSNDVLVGNDSANRIRGVYGNDYISGAGGDDVLAGEYGDDNINGGSGLDTVTYIYAFSGVTVDLAISAPQDTIGDGIDTLKLIENLTGSYYDDNLSGTGAANTIEGETGNDMLWGRGGNDILRGGSDDDILNGGTGDDRLVGGDGFDMASYAGSGSAVTVTLASVAAQNTIGAGTDTISGVEGIIGSSYADTLTGNGSANRLDGGAGADTMTGGGGNDVYIVDNVGDVIVESGGGGTDTVFSSVHYSLGSDVEKLTLSGASNLNGFGNGLNNVITGNSGDNILGGGLGNDTLTGGDGKDRFRFDTALNSATNVDTITDFSVVDDTFQLDDDAFVGIGALGTLNANAFVIGSSAADGGDRIIYDSATGDLYFDADGTGAGAQILFAHIGPGLGLTNADFIIIA
ncbi:MAG TPA: calcium-binding protein [Sphingomicrobium sp.]|nr:calcium-binding protein [Sphingomicrobium sp.]